MNRRFLCKAGAATILCCSPAEAELSLPIAWRVLSFMQPAPASGTVAIVVEPGSAASEAEAAQIERAIGGGASVGGTVVRARRVSPGALGPVSSYRALFVTAGMRPSSQADVAAAAARASVITITSDPGCVRAGHCVVGITSEPRVQITVNRGAAKAANVRFGSAFLMLVKEI